MKEIKRKPAANLIAFRNGIYDISEDKFFQFSPEYVIRNTHILILKKNYN